MGKYFGTDGFRGEANVNLTADHAYKIGRFLGWYYGEIKRQRGIDSNAKIVIGKDTRRSWRSCCLWCRCLSASRNYYTICSLCGKN